jgi:hypothetical protein
VFVSPLRSHVRPGPARKEACQTVLQKVLECITKTSEEAGLEWSKTVFPTARNLCSIVEGVPSILLPLKLLVRFYEFTGVAVLDGSDLGCDEGWLLLHAVQQTASHVRSLGSSHPVGNALARWLL